MSARRRVRTAAVAGLAALAGAAASPPAGVAAPRVAVGLAEQKAEVFEDPFFDRLVLRHARLHVGWDVLHNPWERERLTRWLLAARGDDVEPLLTFGRSRIDHRRVPTPAQLAAEVVALRAAFPWVRQFAVWNEVNHRDQPTLRRPGLAVRWWRAVRAACPGCTVLPAELLDTPNMLAWVRGFRRRARGSEPPVWGLHNYAEANRFQTRRLRRLLRLVDGDVWLTETGGVVKIRGRSRPSAYPESPRHAGRVMRFLFRKVLRVSPRIRRVYVYNWDANGTADSWDTALVDHRGRPRPAWHELLDALAELRMPVRPR